MGSTALNGVTVNEALSGIFGAISLTSWICLLLPQLYENYQAQSASGLSMLFLFTWLLGDAVNLSGAVLTGLAPMPIVVAGFFCFSDLVLITQCVYYNTREARAVAQTHETTTAEEEPLIHSTNLPGAHIRDAQHEEDALEPIKQAIMGQDKTSPHKSPWVVNTLSVMAIWAVGTAAWFIQNSVRDHKSGATDEVSSNSEAAVVAGQVLGYMSAALYLFARIPQIIKNYRSKSTEGLATLFFLFSLSGNTAYALSIFAYSREPQVIIAAIPWLVGSIGTIAQDCTIFGQIQYYSPERKAAAERRKANESYGAA